MRAHIGSVVFAVVCVACAPATAHRGRPVVHWDPPQSALPADFVKTAKVLFESILDDPKGGEFRDVEIQVGDVWGGQAHTCKTTGWVLPGKPAKAVCWNGLTYTPASVGAPRDLKAFVTGARVVGMMPGGGAMNPGPANNPNTFVGSLLLLSTGEPSLAKEVFDQCSRGYKDLSAQVVGDAVWYRFDRAVLSHMYADDEQAASDARLLADAWPKLQPFLGSREGNSSCTTEDQVRSLADDSERRLKNPRKSPPDLKADAALPTDKRFAAMIDALDEVGARQMGQPGGVILYDSEIVRQLVDVGDPAVDALLDCAEKDERLTRSVSFGRDFARPRTIISVRATAMNVICDILHVHEFGQSADGRQWVAAVRAYWSKMRGLKLDDRLYAALADDKATPKQWLEAAETIVQPRDVDRVGPFSSVVHRKPGTRPAPMRGEPLRAGKSPTVTELMTKRALQMMKDASNMRDSMDVFASADGVILGLAMARWDPKGSLPGLAAIQKQGLLNADKWAQYGMTADHLVVPLAQLASKRLSAGDRSAAADYEALIAKSFGKSAEFLEIDALEPLWSHPEATGKVLRSLISEPNAPLNPVALVKQRNGTYRLDEMLRSPLVDAPGMRRALVRLLSDRSVIGTVWRRTEREVFYQIGSGMSGGYGIPANSAEDPSLIPAIGVKRPFRACDFIACGLRQYTAMPTFRPYWPEGAKDAAQRRIAARLRNPAHLNSGGLNRPRRYLSFDD